MAGAAGQRPDRPALVRGGCPRRSPERLRGGRRRGAGLDAGRRALKTYLDSGPLDVALLDRAATVGIGSVVGSLDVIHLASAQLLGAEVRAVVTYDQRMSTAATALGLLVAAPS